MFLKTIFCFCIGLTAVLPLTALSWRVEDLHPSQEVISIPLRINNQGDVLILGYKDINCPILSIGHYPEPSYYLWNLESGESKLSFIPTCFFGLNRPVLSDSGHVFAATWKPRWFGWSKSLCRTSQHELRYLGSPWGFDVMFREDLFFGHYKHDLRVIGVNSSGDVLIGDQCCQRSSDVKTKFALYSAEKFQSIRESSLSAAYAINNNGDILGKNGNKIVLYNWQQGKSEPLFSALEVNIKGFNDHNQIIGTKESRGFLWDPKKLWIDLDFIPVAINGMDQIIGFRLEDGRKDWLFWDQGTVVPFIEELPEEWITILELTSINDAGQVVGEVLSAYDLNGHAALFFPIQSR